MSHHHVREVCEKCGIVLIQCRCMEPKVDTPKGLCKKCEAVLSNPSVGRKADVMASLHNELHDYQNGNISIGIMCEKIAEFVEAESLRLTRERDTLQSERDSWLGSKDGKIKGEYWEVVEGASETIKKLQDELAHLTRQTAVMREALEKIAHDDSIGCDEGMTDNWCMTVAKAALKSHTTKQEGA